MSVQVDQNRAIAAATPEGEVVNAQGARGRSAGKGIGADTGQQDGGRGAQPERLEEASPRCAARSKPNSGKPLIQALRPPRRGSNDLRESFRKDLARTVGSIAEEFARMQHELHGDAVPGQVGKAARVARMDAGGRLVTQRTASRRWELW